VYAKETGFNHQLSDCQLVRKTPLWILLNVARMGEERKVYNVLVGNSERKRPLERPRRRWEDEIRMYLREIGWGV
jgi:hypothetical protein